MVGQLHCPLFAVFGDEDQNPTVAQSEELRTRAQRAGKDVTIKVYKNAGHAFLADTGRAIAKLRRPSCGRTPSRSSTSS